MNPNSALIWLPPIQHAGLPVPRTEVVRYDPKDLFPLFDGQPIRDSFLLLLCYKVAKTTRAPRQRSGEVGSN